ncbi:MAG: anthranilate phosphoribosyltransferase [Candidatus Thiodiazotropha lotti]|uniref:Anthranilate phosphoribosyltransferase n=1 Tax=Candidatus Thiodiazotropha endoloripes TaxID=1818881 RepID=A0A1E2UM61_9GAMM|nr:anthranilate phosphoribosyltransferase [Candidatus Thiodiazotropha endoloripes]MCG7897053.1 anthranilate phosphoribosyltransferase [Candidatus Thiodiazotropha weberae]MCG7991713.1 anthranilate phosphoribosyltransferase [Candidatus Thiodiazotropha lotti]MCG7904499.1 anthranilate phosphoribosyltransferase [Candidatus Thiodiazotropha weberae]MCG7913158.1 anthranilate phosphoribosyltransferase [Candidatus Thiodiazotropha weberae]MCG7999737.1 anthranilate phosphoribosyltransferase [Candidatus Th
MEMQQAINKVLARQDLTGEEMTGVMRTIMTGGATAAQIGGFLIGLRMKGETVAEIAAAASVMRELASGVSIGGLSHPVDIVGTGGDASGTFNVSTACMFVAAAAGCHVAKHGNRSVSSKSGSADALEAAGVRLDLTPEQVEQCVREVGVGFMFAPGHHSAMKHAIGPRKEMGVRTIFNVLGPLTNPAGVPNLLLGVFSSELLEPLAEVLQRLGSHHVMVVHSRDGLDEISIGDATDVAELKDGQIRRFSIQPEDFGITRNPLKAIQVNDAAESLSTIRGVLEDNPGPARDIVMINAGAAIYTSGNAATLQEGVDRANEAIASGEARNRLDRLVVLTQSFD